MSTEEQINKLESTVGEIKSKLDGLHDILARLNENIKTMNVGLYGDEKNNHIGVIERQKMLEDKISFLERKIVEIEKINKEQDTLIKAKKNVFMMIFEGVKWISLIYLVAKGVFGFDSLFGKFF